VKPHQIAPTQRIGNGKKKKKTAIFMRTLVTRETERRTTYGRGANRYNRRVVKAAAGYDWSR
jgi:hypothetical protein